jgi:putative Holliday junction resolvase
MASATAAGTVLAFDFGTERIGVAVGETQLGVAHPLATLSNRGSADAMEQIAALVREWRPALLLVGLPTHADGTPHAMTVRARSFARRLETRFAIPVAFGDERYTTRSAAVALRAASTNARHRKAARDRVAAQIILQDYLDRRLAS